LRAETLESRTLLAAGFGCEHNFVDPEDVNVDGGVTPLDALVVVNQLNDSGEREASQDMFTDVNGDGTLTPLDAMLVINRMAAARHGDNASGAPIESRINRLRDAIESGNLPDHVDADKAQELLASLENGGRPELGERFPSGPMKGSGPQGDALLGSGKTRGKPQFDGGRQERPDMSEEARQQRVMRLREAIESGDLPEGVDAERAARMLERLQSGERPEGGARHGADMSKEARGQRIGRLREAVETGNLPEGVDAEKLTGKLAALENGERPGRSIGGMDEAARDEHIARLREAIESGNLPEGVDAERADQMLERLQSGERPMAGKPGKGGDMQQRMSQLRAQFGAGQIDVGAFTKMAGKGQRPMRGGMGRAGDPGQGNANRAQVFANSQGGGSFMLFG